MTRPLSVPEVAEILGVHVNTVKRTSPKELPYFRIGKRGDRRYDPTDVIAYKEARRET